MSANPMWCDCGAEVDHMADECPRWGSQYECPSCFRVALWTDGTEDEFWCQTCGTESPITACRRIAVSS